MNREPLVEVLEELRERGMTTGIIGNSGETHLGFSCLFAAWRHETGQDRRPSMTASYGLEGPSILKCHRCGYVGTLCNALRDLNKKEKGAITSIVHRVQELEADRTVSLKPRSTIRIPTDFSKTLTELRKNPIPKEALDFLESKGCSRDAATSMLCAWVPFGTFESPSGVLYKIHDALVFPILTSQKGNLVCVGAQAREINRKEGRQKYFTLLAFNSADYFFGDHLLSTIAGRTVCLVEGPLDAMHLISLGVPALGLMGVYLSKRKAAKLKAASPRRVLVMLDADVAGQTGSDKVIKTLEEEKIPYRRVVLHKDPKQLTIDDMKKWILSKDLP